MRSTMMAALFFIASAARAAPGYQLFPVRGVFFPAEEGPSRIDADFRRACGGEEQAYFAAKFRERFPDAAGTISEGNQRRTYAVSLQIARASRYVVRKVNGTVDVYLSVTGSLYFSNVMTGEVLYAATRTTVKTITLIPEEARPGGDRIVRLFADTYRGVVEDLIGDARERFHPLTVNARVVKEWKGLAILDGGQERGLGRDDALVDARGNELRVISAGPKYAIASVSLGTFSRGDTFSKVTHRTLAEIRKPRVLPFVELAPPGFPEEVVVQLFSDALGAEAPVSLVPVNRTFGAVVRALGAQIDLSKETLSRRELPGLFVRLHVLDPISYERPTNLGYKTVRITEALAYAEVVERSGRVIYAGWGRDRIEDEITQGMSFDLEARKEIAVKNALLALAKRFSAELRLETARLEVTRGGASLVVEDQNGVLAPDATFRVYRNLGKVEGIAGDVRVPTWEVGVTATGGGAAQVSPVLPIVDGAPLPERGDVVIVDGVAAGEARWKRFGACGTAEQLGPVTLPAFPELALNLFVAGYRAPFYASGLAARVSALVHGGSGFKEDLRLHEPTVDYCVQPVYRMWKGEPRCSGNACADVAEVQLGYRIRVGDGQGQVKASSGLATRMTASALPTAATAETRDAAFQADLIDQVLTLGPGAAAGLAKEKL